MAHTSARPVRPRPVPAALPAPLRLGGLVQRVAGILHPRAASDPLAPTLRALSASGSLSDAPAAADRVAETGDIALLREAARAHPFSHYEQVRAARSAPEAGVDVAADPPERRQERLGPRARRALEPAVEVDGGVPVSRYLHHVHATLPEGRDTDLSASHDAARFALWYAAKGATGPRGGTPIGAALAECLNADASSPWEGQGRLSRLMQAMGGATAAQKGWQALADWWLDAAGDLPGILTPDWFAERMAHVPAEGRGTPFAMGAQLLAIHARSDTYRRAYDLREPAARVAFVFDMLLHLYDTPTRRLAFNPQVTAWFASPLDGRQGAPSRFETLLALHAGRTRPAPDDEGGVEELRHWFRARACRVFPAFAAFASLPEAEWTAGDTTLELVGMARSDTGLGQNLRMSAAALARAGIAHRLRDSEAGFTPSPGRAGSGDAARRPRRKAMLLHLNADRAPQALCAPLFDRHPDMHAIGFFLWELEALPAAHRLALDLVDEIWCPSRFLADVYARHSERPVHWVGKAITLPTPRLPDRRRFGLAHADFVFLTCFDFHSSVERKNPLAAVDAFQRAFPPAPCAKPGTAVQARHGRRWRQRSAGAGGTGAGEPRLLIKTTPPVAGHWGDPNGMWPRLVEAASADPRIVIVADHLPFAELVGLVALADALVSPHRAEGFGYLPAYALSLARPVLATDYGGTTDFVTAETGFPLPWRPREIAPGETILPVESAFWADVDLDALAEAMATLFERPEEGRHRALAGQRLMQRDYAPEALAGRYRDRLRAAGIIA